MIKSPFKSKNNNISSKEGGRSMVEVLGVLAVIGVLSVGTFTGYRYGMNKTRANELVAEMSVRLTGIVQQLSQNSHDVTMEMGDKTKHGYAINSSLDDQNNRYFYIDVENVPTGVCREILKLQWQAPVEIYVNEFMSMDGAAACGGGDMTPLMEFKFDKYMDVIETNENPNSTYQPEATKDDGGCAKGKPLKSADGQCYPCGTMFHVYVQGVESNCNVCSNRYLFNNAWGNSMCALKCSGNKLLKSDENYCYPCDEPRHVLVAGVESNCNVCPNRYLIEIGGREYCALKCLADKPLQDRDGACYDCDEAKGVFVYGVTANCTVCPNRKVNGNSTCILKTCPADKPLQASLGTCFACDEPNSVNVQGVTVSCNVCPNRKMNGNYCALKCPAEKPLMDYNGTCFACDDLNSVNVYGVTANCKVCSNRKLYGNHCVLPCTADKPLVNAYGGCYACDELNGVYVYGVTANCKVCPNRKVNGNYCALK